MSFSVRGWALLAAVALGTPPADPALAEPVNTERFAGRDVLVFVPPQMPAAGTRALVIVLHGGLGNAAAIESGTGEGGLRLDDRAAKDGFVVAYLNGTPAGARLEAEREGWNAGDCCGLPAASNVDDVGYITKTAAHLIAEYGADPSRVFIVGHSNGAMMALRMMCETTTFAAAVAVSGPLENDARACPAARGRRILSIHGALDDNVPITGGRASQGLANVAFVSEQQTQAIFRASGADIHLEIVPGAGHRLSEIDDNLQGVDGISLAQKVAQFFDLARASAAQPVSPH